MDTKAKQYWPTDGNLTEVAHHMCECGLAWVPDMRLIGNCRALDIAAVADGYLRLERDNAQLRNGYLELLGQVEQAREGFGIYHDSNTMAAALATAHSILLPNVV
jgi:hypothetical protein